MWEYGMECSSSKYSRKKALTWRSIVSQRQLYIRLRNTFLVLKSVSSFLASSFVYHPPFHLHTLHRPICRKTLISVCYSVTRFFTQVAICRTESTLSTPPQPKTIDGITNHPRSTRKYLQILLEDSVSSFPFVVTGNSLRFLRQHWIQSG